MQQLLLLAVLTLRHHPTQPLEVITAVLAAELIHLALPKAPLLVSQAGRRVLCFLGKQEQDCRAHPAPQLARHRVWQK